jgi:hypothetical protein
MHLAAKNHKYCKKNSLTCLSPGRQVADTPYMAYFSLDFTPFVAHNTGLIAPFMAC